MCRYMYSEIFYVMKVVEWEVICDDTTDGNKILFLHDLLVYYFPCISLNSKHAET
jgi:hypothetical protein